MDRYCKRLIEVDLPIKRISAHARREKSIRHGHISTLHIWWARRPLAACRAVVCAALWPDPGDPLGPDSFRDAARKLMQKWATEHLALLSPESMPRFVGFQKNPEKLHDNEELRYALLDFIADFANWDNSTKPAYLETSRTLTQTAHEALGGLPGTKPLVVDPFAGGGAIPLEALRVGAEAFASDLNPVAVLINKVMLEYIPKYGQQLAEEVHHWGQWVKEQAERKLGKYYPTDPDGAAPIAYLWARTILSEAPGEGAAPIEVPLIRSLWLAKKAGRKQALRWLRDAQGRVQTTVVEVTYADGTTRQVRRPLLEIFTPKRDSEVEAGTVARGSATCPVTGYTTHVNRVREQLKTRRGGTDDARLFCVVTMKSGSQGRFYRLPTKQDIEAVHRAARMLEKRQAVHTGALSLVPDELLDVRGIRHTWAMIYGLDRWVNYFVPRQTLTLATLVQLVQEVGVNIAVHQGNELSIAVQTCLALLVDKVIQYNSSLCRWKATGENLVDTFGRQAIPMVWDFCEANIFGGASGDFGVLLRYVNEVLDNAGEFLAPCNATTQCASATHHPLPDDSANAFVTDPPYYDAIAYAYLSDFFYAWLRRSLVGNYPDIFRGPHAPKDEEIVVDRPHELSNSTHDITFYECELTKAFTDGRRILRPDGIGTIVFASKTTASWEAIIQAVVDAGLTITGSWPIDTEMETRVAAQGQARLASSIHLVCRPRESLDGSIRTDTIGDWREVLAELPRRIHAWMPRLAAEGVVGADAIFACLGPALEIFSQYSGVEKASGEKATLKEYLEHVWAAVSQEALGMIFEGADATGFEEDARLTAIWYWVMKAANGQSSPSDSDDETEKSASAEERQEEGGKTPGCSMEYDAARKLAQGLGADLRILSRPGGIVTIRGNVATLNSIASRERYLLGQQLALFGGDATPHLGRPTRRERPPSIVMRSVSARQSSLFAEKIPAPTDPSQPFLPSLKPTDDARSVMDRLMERGVTVLDRLHQAMLLFGRAQTSLLRPFLQETHMGHNPRFWRLAQALSALYPAGTDEKRWIDGVLARKKGLGFV